MRFSILIRGGDLKSLALRFSTSSSHVTSRFEWSFRDRSDAGQGAGGPRLEVGPAAVPGGARRLPLDHPLPRAGTIEVDAATIRLGVEADHFVFRRLSVGVFDCGWAASYAGSDPDRLTFLARSSPPSSIAVVRSDVEFEFEAWRRRIAAVSCIPVAPLPTLTTLRGPAEGSRDDPLRPRNREA